ncbi:VWFA domain-containing protein [Psidium guajava]|nr:VWFA domain-containing protein [Psidium guajava]
MGSLVASCFVVAILQIGGLYGGADGAYVKYNTDAGIVEGKLNVHLVPHSHDDVGWLKTVDQYYVGSNNSIQGACIENVLDSVVVALAQDPNRKFVFAEMVLC